MLKKWVFGCKNRPRYSRERAIWKMRFWLLLQPQASARRLLPPEQCRKVYAQEQGGFWVVAQQHFFLLLQLRKFRVEICKIWSDFLRFCKFLKGLRIFRDYLWFPAIPTKFCGNLNEKSPILDDFSNILRKFQRSAEIFANFRKNMNLERCKGMSIL